MTDEHEDKKLTPQEWRDKGLGDTEERMRAQHANEFTQADWATVPEKDLGRVYELMKRQGTRPLPLGDPKCPKECCPICGHEFDPVREANVCPTAHYGEQVWTPEQLITGDDDYAWVE
jgi:hypothetical protein